MALSGSGTEADPYLIANATDLKDIENYLSEGYYFKQTANITLGTFETIGYSLSSYTFTGHYDGDNYKIQNGTINHTNTRRIGIFRIVSNSTFKNMYFKNIHIGGYSHTGMIAGVSSNCSFSNLYIDSDSQVLHYTDNYGGGFIGYAGTSTFNQCANAGAVYSPNYSAGGICGYNEGCIISNCYNKGYIDGTYAVGGICGHIDSYGNPKVENCYNLGDISGEMYVGGIVGYAYSSNAIVTKCFALNNSIIRYYGTSDRFGRICYNATAYFSDNYALDTMSEPFTGAWTTKTATGKDGADITIENAKKQTSYSSLGWDFSTIWFIIEDSSFPYQAFDIPDMSFFKIYTGSEWSTIPMKMYTGSEWVSIPTKTYSGSEWV